MLHWAHWSRLKTGYWRQLHSLSMNNRKFRGRKISWFKQLENRNHLRWIEIIRLVFRFCFQSSFSFIALSISLLHPIHHVLSIIFLFSYLPSFRPTTQKNEENIFISMLFVVNIISFFDCHFFGFLFYFLLLLHFVLCSQKKYQLWRIVEISAGWFFIGIEIRRNAKRANCVFILNCQSFALPLKFGNVWRFRY